MPSTDLTWNEWIKHHQATGLVELSTAFGERPWEPTEADRKAAWTLYTQLRTRIATQPLHYRAGDEETALDSLYKLFDLTRVTLDKQGPDCRNLATITTLMLNFIALNIMEYLIFNSNSPWRDPEVVTFPSGRPIPDVSRLPEFFRRVDIGIFVAIGLAVLAWYLINRTRWGFEVRVVGDSPDAARYTGISVPRKILGIFLKRKDTYYDE